MVYSLFICHAQLLRRCFSSKTPIYPYQNENLHFSATKLSRNVWLMVLWCTGNTSTPDTNNSKSVCWQCPLRSGSTVKKVNVTHFILFILIRNCQGRKSLFVISLPFWKCWTSPFENLSISSRQVFSSVLFRESPYLFSFLNKLESFSPISTLHML